MDVHTDTCTDRQTDREMKKKRKDYFAAPSGQGNLCFMMVLARILSLFIFFRIHRQDLTFIQETANSSYLGVEKSLACSS